MTRTLRDALAHSIATMKPGHRYYLQRRWWLRTALAAERNGLIRVTDVKPAFLMVELPLPEAPVAASPGAVAPTGTVASLRALARRRGLRSAGGRPIHAARRADLLAALTA